MKKESVKTNVILLLIVLFSFVAMIAKLSYVSLSKIIDGKDLMEFAKSRNTVIGWLSILVMIAPALRLIFAAVNGPWFITSFTLSPLPM